MLRRCREVYSSSMHATLDPPSDLHQSDWPCQDVPGSHRLHGSRCSPRTVQRGCYVVVATCFQHAQL